MNGPGSMQGWYPDPGGGPGQYRYFDGASWSAELTTDPSQPPPVPGAGSRKHPTGLLFGVLTLVLLLIIGGIVVLRNAGSNDQTADPLPSSTVSGWDDSSPTPTPSPTQSQSSADPPPASVSCPFGQPDERAQHPADGRVYGGNLSFAEVPSFEPPAPEPRLSFAYDVTQQYEAVSASPGWIAQLAVGQLRATDDFTGTARTTAEAVADCSISGDMYIPYGPNRKDVRSEKVTITGRQGWLIETDVTVVKEGLPFAGDHIVFIVVGDGDNWGLFFGAVPIGDAARTKILNGVIADLHAS